VDGSHRVTGSRPDAPGGDRGRERLPRRNHQAETCRQRQERDDRRINDFIFGKDGNTYAILAVGDFTGLGGHLIAVPFRNLKLDDPSGYVVLPGASRSALEKLPVFVSNNR
jgi:hypothetical protein